MKIRDKFLLVFGLYILLTVIFGSFAYRSLRMISTSLILVEKADDITNNMLEIRIYEKNYLLFKNQQDLRELITYLGVLKNSLENIRAEIISEMDNEGYLAMKKAIADYEQMVIALEQNFKSQAELASSVVSAGKKLEQSLAGSNLTSFLELRRHERNIMLNKDRVALEAVTKNLDAASLGKYPEIENYRILMMKLFQLYEEENALVEAMRLTARKIQSSTQNLAREKRRGMSRTIKTSTTLLVIAVVLIIVLGIIINIRLATSIAAPIRNLERITKKIMQGDFSESIAVKGHDEIAILARCYNQMEEKLDLAMTSLEEIIEKLREKQARLVEAEKLAAIGKLAAGIAHEINNPLTAVLTFSNLMLEQCPENDPCCARLRLMARETERARNIVRQLLNFGRETVIRPKWININQPVTEITESLMAQESFKGIDLSTGLAESLPEVYADPAQIGQVVMNILLNAIHAITPPGRIEVVTRFNNNHVEVVFTDTGRGVPKEHLNKIFDPFFTTKDASIGTGLGLAVSYGIIKKHGGDIEVASEEGKGTTFTVRLPIKC